MVGVVFLRISENCHFYSKIDTAAAHRFQLFFYLNLNQAPQQRALNTLGVYRRKSLQLQLRKRKLIRTRINYLMIMLTETLMR
jgi:hypothetical protein